MTEEKRDELEKLAIDIIKNHSHRLIENFSETDLINREITIFFEGYRTAEREWKRKKAMWKIILEILRTVLISAFLMAVAFGSIVLLAWLIKEILV